MLYDPKWENNPETKTEPETLEHLIEWLRQQDPNETYCYGNSGGCLLAKYYRNHLGYELAQVGSFCVILDRCKYKHLPENFDLIAVNLPRTFGAALKRAESLL